MVTALCQHDGCEELARYVETGDGHAVLDPDRFCHDHKPDIGLWRDLKTKMEMEVFARYD